MDKLIAPMINAAYKSLPNAYAPYSNFSVASCIRSSTNNLYTGVNVENTSFSLGICAESSAICNMVAAGERQIISIVVLAGTNLLCPPCGACRQRIHEFSTPDTLVHLCNKESVLRSLTLEELLPLAFNFKL